MSLGGITAIALAALEPELVRSLVLVDITPGVDEYKASGVMAFVNGPESFDSFDDLLARTVAFSPTRSESSLRRGILHNAVQREDGSWVWRYARHRALDAAAAPSADAEAVDGDAPTRHHPEFGSLWDAVSGLAMPVMLARGTAAGSVVDDADEAELVRRCPHARVEHVTDAGHSIQGDRPVELAELIADFVA